MITQSFGTRSRPVEFVVTKEYEILTPDMCQICRQHGPGIVTVRGLNGRRFSAHRWPCAVTTGLRIDSSDPRSP